MSDFRPTKRKANAFFSCCNENCNDNDHHDAPTKNSTLEEPITASLLSSKLNEMSMEERSSGLYDLHCISDRIKETPELIRAKIAELTAALESIVSNQQKKKQIQQDQHKYDNEDNDGSTNQEKKNSTYSLGFRMAFEKSPKYIESQKLRFLRAEKFNSEAAADRMVRFFEYKLEYYGEEILARDIQFGDLEEDDVNALEAGALQILPERDQAGRAIILMDGKVNLAYSTRTMIRIHLYFVTAVHEDEESQKNGTVAIYYGLGQRRVVPGRAAENWGAFRSIPIILAAGHYCRDSEVLIQNNAALINAMDNRPLCRLRFHFGSQFETIFILMTFGIPKDALPYRDDGSMDLTHHRQVLETLKYREKYGLLSSSPSTASDYLLREDNESSTPPRRYLDSPSTRSVSPIPCLSDEEEEEENIMNDDILSSSPSSPLLLSNPTNTSTSTSTDNNNKLNSNKSDNKNIILVLGQMDLLLGRGRQQQTRPGMIRLNYLLEEHWDQFEAASKFEKTVIVEIVLKLMKESNCRFLNAVPGGYYEESDDVAARSKIAHSFRTLRKKKKVINKSSTTPY